MATLVMIDNNWKQFKCPTRDWLNQSGCINTMGHSEMLAVNEKPIIEKQVYCKDEKKKWLKKYNLFYH